MFFSRALRQALSRCASVFRRSGISRDFAWNEAGREITLQKFKKELNLTPHQTEEFGAHLDDFMTYYQYAQAQMEDVRATEKGRILRILQEDQKVKFEKMMGEVKR